MELLLPLLFPGSCGLCWALGTVPGHVLLHSAGWPLQPCVTNGDRAPCHLLGARAFPSLSVERLSPGSRLGWALPALLRVLVILSRPRCGCCPPGLPVQGRCLGWQDPAAAQPRLYAQALTSGTVLALLKLFAFEGFWAGFLRCL